MIRKQNITLRCILVVLHGLKWIWYIDWKAWPIILISNIDPFIETWWLMHSVSFLHDAWIQPWWITQQGYIHASHQPGWYTPEESSWCSYTVLVSYCRALHWCIMKTNKNEALRHCALLKGLSMRLIFKEKISISTYLYLYIYIYM